jgi:sulfopyruvate decarboxylase subunit beta
MKRLEALAAIYPVLEQNIVVTIMGAVAAELQSLGHRPNFFYLQHAMGLASSLGLGIALCRPELRVIVLDGDGSLLMNLGSLSTMARYRPHNLVHIVFDNQSLLSVGGFPTATSTGTDLAGCAAAAGVPRTARADSAAALAAALDEALQARELTTIVTQVEAHYVPPVRTAGFVTELTQLENRFAFARHLSSLRQG